MVVRLRIWSLALALGISTGPASTVAGSLDQLTELTGKVQAIITLTGRDNFASEYRYDVSVRNLSPDTFKADSLIVVLDRITNLAGEDHEGLTGESFLKRFDVVGPDGHTEDGKPYFHLPTGSSPNLLPQTDSPPAVVRIRNRDYVAVFTPSFRVFGQKRAPQESRRGESTSASTPSNAANRAAMDKLIQLLIKKGVLTEDEGRKLTQP